MATVDVRLLEAHEQAVLAKVAPGVFDHPVDRRWGQTFFETGNHHLAVALDGETVVGMASGVHYVHPDKGPELWVNEVGVAPTYQRLGIAKRLLNTLLERGRSLGCAEAWVLTEEDNAAARRLYASVGGEELERPVYVSFELKT